MASKKFSEIAISPTSPTSADYLVGVTAAGVDRRFTVAQVNPGGFPLASQDPRFSGGVLFVWVDPNGNDSGPGTQAQPFKTITHAVRVVTSFSYENVNTPQINVNAGTYNESDIPLPEIFFAPQQSSGEIVGAGAGVTIINAQGGTDGFRSTATALSDWVIQGLTVDSNTRCFSGIGDSTYFAANIECKDSSNSGNMICFFGQNYSIPVTFNITVSGTTIANFYSLRFEAEGFHVGTITLPAALTVTDRFISVTQNSNMLFSPSSITNAGGVTGRALKAKQFSSIYTAHGLVSDIPGTAPAADGTDVDGTSSISNLNGNFDNTKNFFFATQFAGTPANTDLSSGCWTVVKDTSGGGVYVLYNDAGTIKKVALV